MKKYLIYIFLNNLFIVTAQVGIGTETPIGILHIDGGKNNALAIPQIEKEKDDVVFTKSGKLGVGNLSPRTKLDIQSQQGKNIIGIGNTSLSAQNAGEGAIKYTPTGSKYFNLF